MMTGSGYDVRRGRASHAHGPLLAIPERLYDNEILFLKYLAGCLIFTVSLELMGSMGTYLFGVVSL